MSFLSSGGYSSMGHVFNEVTRMFNLNPNCDDTRDIHTLNMHQEWSIDDTPLDLSLDTNLEPLNLSMGKTEVKVELPEVKVEPRDHDEVIPIFSNGAQDREPKKGRKRTKVQKYYVVLGNDRQCLICDGIFPTTKAKTRHLLKEHSIPIPGTSLLKCRECSKTLKNYTNFSRHETVHSKASPYRCMLCKKQYKHAISIRRHLHNDHKEKLLEEADSGDDGIKFEVCEIKQENYEIVRIGTDGEATRIKYEKSEYYANVNESEDKIQVNLITSQNKDLEKQNSAQEQSILEEQIDDSAQSQGIDNKTQENGDQQNEVQDEVPKVETQEKKVKKGGAKKNKKTRKPDDQELCPAPEKIEEKIEEIINVLPEAPKPVRKRTRRNLPENNIVRKQNPYRKVRDKAPSFSRRGTVKKLDEKLKVEVDVHLCGFCNKPFSLPDRKRHIVAEHAIYISSKKYKCVLCEKVCTTPYHLHRHASKHVKYSPEGQRIFNDRAFSKVLFLSSLDLVRKKDRSALL